MLFVDITVQPKVKGDESKMGDGIAQISDSQVQNIFRHNTISQ